MQLSLQADYACRTMMFLALREGRSSIEEVATAYGISLNHLVKIVHRLGKLELITTLRGRGGGIQLARDPATITLGEIVRKIEPSLVPVACLDLVKPAVCCIASSCGLKPTMARAMQAFLTVLDQTALTDAIRDRDGLSQVLGLVPRQKEA